MTDLNELVTDLSNVIKPLEKAGLDLDALASHYEANAWLMCKLMEIEKDLHNVTSKLGQLKTIYDFKGGE